MLPNKIELFRYIVVLQYKDEDESLFVHIVTSNHSNDFYSTEIEPKKKDSYASANEAFYELENIKSGRTSSDYFSRGKEIQEIGVYRFVTGAIGKLERVSLDGTTY